MNIFKYTIYTAVYIYCMFVYIYMLKLPATITFCVEYCIDRIDFLCIFWGIPCSPGFPHASFLLCGMQCLGCRWMKSDRWEVGEVFVYLTQIQMKRANFSVNIFQWISPTVSNFNEFHGWNQNQFWSGSTLPKELIHSGEWICWWRMLAPSMVTKHTRSSKKSQGHVTEQVTLSHSPQNCWWWKEVNFHRHP